MGLGGALLGPCWGLAGALLGPCWGLVGVLLGLGGAGFFGLAFWWGVFITGVVGPCWGWLSGAGSLGLIEPCWGLLWLFVAFWSLNVFCLA